MKMHSAVLVGVLVLAPYAAAQDQAALTKALKDADIVFTGKIGKVNPLGQTNSIPPSTFGNVAFKDTKALRGTVPGGATFNYSFREGTTKNLDLDAAGAVLVAVKQKGVLAIVPATDTNLALAKKALEAPKDK